jgi:hypothetical protein
MFCMILIMIIGLSLISINWLDFAVEECSVFSVTTDMKF